MAASSRRSTKSPIHGSMRLVLVVGVMSYYANKHLQSYFFPFGLPISISMEDRVSWATVDKSNDSLQAKHGKLTKIIERVEDGQKPLLKGPETVILDEKGTLYAFSRGATLVKLDDFQPSPDGDPQMLTARATVAAELGHGTPLSGKFTKDGKTLYVVDPMQGLFRIRNFHSYPNSKTELVANKVEDNGVMTRINHADDVAIGKSGKVYFSDATEIYPDRLHDKGDWDILYASKLDFMRGKRTGRLLQYDPATEEVKVLVRDLWFANGVAVDKDETYVVVSQTFAMTLSKFYLSGPNQGTFETIIDSHQLAGFTDGADCSWETNGPTAGKCYVAVPTEIMTVAKLIQKLPPPFDYGSRFLLMMLPKWLAPKPTAYCAVVEVDMQTGETRTFQDPDATDMEFLTGVTVHGNKLYLGSLHRDVVGVYNLS